MKEDVRFTFAKQYTLNMKQESGIILNSHCAIKCSLQANIYGFVV